MSNLKVTKDYFALPINTQGILDANSEGIKQSQGESSLIIPSTDIIVPKNINCAVTAYNSKPKAQKVIPQGIEDAFHAKLHNKMIQSR